MYIFRLTFIDDLERITRGLEIYLACFVEEIPINLRSKDIEEITPDYIINFNYTNTYEKIYHKNENVFYIHGRCKKDNTIEDNNMVLGIDEYWSEDQRDNHTNFSIFKKFVQRIRKKTGIANYIYLNNIKNIFEESGKIWSDSADISTTYTDGTTVVYTFGHSLDITDIDILKDFFKNEAVAVKVFCMDKGKEGELIANVINIVGEQYLLEQVNQAPPKMEFLIQSEMIDKE